jgi:membrane-bound lytic murein transglycosylase D
VAPAPAEDPVARLIELSRRHFETGERELKLGHLESARAEFDRAVEVLLESPQGARSDARLREYFDRLVDRINAHEVTALAQGDGFTEKRYEPARIDEILAVSTFPKPDPGLDTEQTVQADLEATTHDVPIPLNGRVLSYVELFQGRLRDFLAEGLQRGSQYLPMIQNVFRAEGLPLDLAYVPLVESAFKSNALSRASAKGMWQFMRGTALENGLRQDWYVDERSDPEKATRAAAKYLGSLFAMFDGDWHLALASYNGGPYRVRRALKTAGLADFWTLTRTSRYLPRETREYVPMILAAIIIAKNPTQYGFEPVVAEPLRYDTVTVPLAIDLRRAAEWTGASIDEIQALNPELRRWTTPITDDGYTLKIPSGTAGTFQTRLAETPRAELVTLNRHTVKRGESLSTIARKLKVSRVELAGANGLATNARLREGQALVVPRAPATLLASRANRPAPAADVVVASRSVGGGEAVVYRVKRGDTLFEIARLFDTTVNAIKSWNRLRSNLITPGDRLKIFASRDR